MAYMKTEENSVEISDVPAGSLLHLISFGNSTHMSSTSHRYGIGNSESDQMTWNEEIHQSSSNQAITHGSFEEAHEFMPGKPHRTQWHEEQPSGFDTIPDAASVNFDVFGTYSEMN
jgi:hypothetical protein